MFLSLLSFLSFDCHLQCSLYFVYLGLAVMVVAFMGNPNSNLLFHILALLFEDKGVNTVITNVQQLAIAIASNCSSHYSVVQQGSRQPQFSHV